METTKSDFFYSNLQHMSAHLGKLILIGVCGVCRYRPLLVQTTVFVLEMELFSARSTNMCAYVEVYSSINHNHKCASVANRMLQCEQNLSIFLCSYKQLPLSFGKSNCIIFNYGLFPLPRRVVYSRVHGHVTFNCVDTGTVRDGLILEEKIPQFQ